MIDYRLISKILKSIEKRERRQAFNQINNVPFPHTKIHENETFIKKKKKHNWSKLININRLSININNIKKKTNI